MPVPPTPVLTYTLSSTKAPSVDRVNVHGILRNYNTVEDFKNADKTALLDSLGDEVRSFAKFMRRTCAHRIARTPQIWSRVNSSSSDVDADALNPFLVLTFADLKKYRYYYWCGFPALLQKPGWESEGEWSSASGVLSEEQVCPATLAAAARAHLRLLQLSAVNDRQQASSPSFALARPNTNGFCFSPISSATDFFADIPVAEVSSR